MNLCHVLYNPIKSFTVEIVIKILSLKDINLCHILNDPIKSLLIDIFKRFATMELLQVAELHVNLLLVLK